MVSAFLENFEMMGFTQRMVLVCALVLLAGPIQLVLAEANAVEIDVYETAMCWQELITPLGTETVIMTGRATVHVFFEGPEEGTAYDDDGDTLDEVQTEMVELNLSGYSPMLGLVRMRLNTNYRSTGMMEETINNRSGVLDVPPFTQNGTVESFFDIFFEVEMLGQTLYGEGPMRWRGLLREKPAGPLDLYENQVEIRLLDSNGQLTPYSWGANRFRPNPLVEIDVFETAMCWQDIVLPGGSTEIVIMTGQATEHVFFEGAVEGSANDDDGDGLDEVQTEMVELDLRGYSAMLGPVRMRLNTNYRSTGMMEETINDNDGLLDVPPFAKTGSVESFFDVFFEVEIAGQVFLGEGPMRWRGLLREKPAGPLDLYENQADIQLMDENGNPTNFYFSAGRYRPNPVVEIDVLDTSIGSLVLTTPSGQEYAVGLMGQSEIHVFFEGAVEGAANDDDGDGLDEVRTELVQLDLSGSGSELGAVHLRLNRDLRSLGEMEETANSNMGVLDVPPFASEGMIDSFFDVYFEIEFTGQVMYGQGPMLLRGVLNHKPAAPGDIYENREGISLVDADGRDTGCALGTVRYEPIACGDAEHPYPIGDLNKDCEVNFFDIAILSLHWLECTRPECN